ncbi:uncharacterized protein LOC122256315 isoform X1 [Penaeus japonicus]|uniref:uncharacterized protein LOC122256315 isoform X1 n=3 Tax=Penaeus japonicus TaxID=27405 RepID=UPI001C7171C7|nr:uncharacterized protein LOC122256315 isoform X1 [Penaeus japonicus]
MKKGLAMPFFGRDAAVLCVLVFCVPIQYWLTQRSFVSPDHRTAEVYKLVEEVRHFASNWLSAETWQDWLIGMKKKFIANDYSHWYTADTNDPEGECPAVEVWHLRSPKGMFAMSPRPRTNRPLGVRWRVGQVVKHKRWGYKGVIIGWDLKCKAPESWIEQMHDGHKHWRDQPNYALLVDTKDRKNSQITYVPQENISPVLKEEVTHPEMGTYFDFYDGAQYIPSPWLRAIYPLD